MRRIGLAVLFLAAPAVAADREPAPLPRVVLTGFKSPKQATPADPKTFKTVAAGPFVAGFVGVEVLADPQGRAKVAGVAPDSPAELAGLKEGDVVSSFAGTAVPSAQRLRDLLRGTPAVETVKLVVERDGKALELSVTPRPASRPLTATAGGRIVLGVTSGDSKPTGGIEVSGVTPGGGADKGGVKAKDIVLQIDGTKLGTDSTIAEALSGKKAGDVVKLLVKRGEEEVELRVTLQAEEPTGPGGGRFGGGWDDRLPRAWSRPSYKLAIIGVEYPDVKHNPKIKDADWEASMFSEGTYHAKTATGQTAHGSMADYYQEISYGKFHVEGKFVGWVEVSKKRTEYSTGSGTDRGEKTRLLTEAMDKLVAKDKDALKGYDGVFFLYAGGRVQTTRGGLYWPHRASVRHKEKSWPYFIVQEGGERMTDISVFCHEFGHMLGLPDLYARPEVPGMEGVGVWCAMSQQNGGGQPQHFSVWSKDQLGWVKPTAIDPRVKQKIVLKPIEDDPTECLKVLVKPDGSEYFLLENRKKKGFDAALPAEGLLIWRVLPGNQTQRVFLEEAHGVEGPTGPRQHLTSVPFPCASNNSFTPYTTPSSKSQTGGGLDVYITNIRKLPDGRVTFHIGYEYQ